MPLDVLDTAIDYIRLRAPLVSAGDFGLEVRGVPLLKHKDKLDRLLSEAIQYKAKTSVNGVVSGIVVDYNNSGPASIQGDILILPALPNYCIRSERGELYILAAVLGIVLCLVLLKV